MPRLTRILAAVYIALMPVAWPVLPGNLHGIDLLFPLLAVMVLASAPRRRPTLTMLDYAVGLYVLSAMPSLLVTPDLAASTLAIVKTLYLAALYVVFGIYFAREGVGTGVRVWTTAAAILCASGVLAALLYLATGVELPFLGDRWVLPVGSVFRVWAGTDSAEMLGNYLTVAFPLIAAGGLTAWPRESGRWLAQASAAVTGMVLTFSHAVAGFAAATLIAIWPFARARVPAPVRYFAVAGAVIVGILVNVMLVISVRGLVWSWDRNPDVTQPAYYYAWQTAAGADRVTMQLSYNPMSYFLIKKVALSAFAEHPWTGAGAGTFHRLTEKAFQEGRLHEPYRAIDPHSTIAGALAEKGVFGGLGVVALLLAAIVPRRGPRESADGWVGLAFKAGVIGLAVNSLNADIMNFRFLWIALAALRALDRGEPGATTA